MKCTKNINEIFFCKIFQRINDMGWLYMNMSCGFMYILFTEWLNSKK